MSDTFFAHEAATVDDGAKIGKGTKIWHYSHIMGGAIIGERCILGQGVFVAATAIIGNGVKIQNSVSVYDSVILEDDVFCGPSMVFTNVNHPRAFIERKTEYETTRVGCGASIGANATIVCGITIGAYAFIGAGAVVNKDLPDYALAVGVPARQIGWVCKCGYKLPEQLICSECGDRYEEQDGMLKPA
jgi:UDP-2-acetamido-3-amino-2,3-dideoxy-glucuronate N-acetyltransferase